MKTEEEPKLDNKENSPATVESLNDHPFHK
jgi:hypothetical protein